MKWLTVPSYVSFSCVVCGFLLSMIGVKIIERPILTSVLCILFVAHSNILIWSTKKCGDTFYLSFSCGLSGFVLAIAGVRGAESPMLVLLCVILFIAHSNILVWLVKRDMKYDE